MLVNQACELRMTDVTDRSPGPSGERPPPSPSPPRRPPGRRKDPLGPDGEIGTRLRALYAEFEQEPIPPDLIELLEQLDEAERRGRP
jgi:hypothetical protein